MPRTTSQRSGTTRKRPTRGGRPILKCMQCRKAKVSCDEVKPSCERCVKRQTACTYVKQDMTTGAIAQPPRETPSRRDRAAETNHGGASSEDEHASSAPRFEYLSDLRSESQSPLQLPPIESLLRVQDFDTRSIYFDMCQTSAAHPAASCGNLQSAGIIEKLSQMKEEYHAAQQRVQDEEIALPDLEECELEFTRTNSIARECRRTVEEASEALNAACVNHEVASANLNTARERMRDLSLLKQQAAQLRDHYNMQWAKLGLDKL